MRDKIKLNYEKRGEGAPFVLLHGNDGDLTYFKNQVEFFSRSRTVIAVDTRGHGKSPRGRAEFTLETFALDLVEFFDSLNLQRADILGFSDGANIAMLFALKYPHRVRTLVLNGGNFVEDGLNDDVREDIHKAFACARDTRSREMAELMIGQPNLSEKELSSITAPTLVIVGDKDMIKPEHSRTLARILPNAEFAELHGSHFIAEDNPNEFNAFVDKFLVAACEKYHA